jgi:hypothetical protein
MKFKILQILLLSSVFVLINSGLVFAQPQNTVVRPPETPASATPQQIAPTADFLPHIVGVNQTSKVNLVNNLPSGDWYTVIGSIIKLVLAITGSLAFASFTYGGVMLVTAQGDDSKFKKGKDILYMSVLALIIIAVSYAIVLGITQLKFFQ